MKNVIAGLVLSAPIPQNQLDIFAGEWAYKIPIAGTESGVGPGFLHKHPCIWLCEQAFGSLHGMNCLELGPNEGEVSYHLHHASCREVIAIEARVRSYLKCLIAKNLLHLHSVQFELGDFVKHLETVNREYDLCLAAGVLYHMEDPVRILELICRKAKRVAIATHYFDPSILTYDPKVDQSGLPTAIWNFPNPEGEERSYAGKTIKYYKYFYATNKEGHETYGHGGTEMFANMITRNDLFMLLDHFGMRLVGDIRDEPQGARGPFINLVAERKTNGPVWSNNIS